MCCVKVTLERRLKILDIIVEKWTTWWAPRIVDENVDRSGDQYSSNRLLNGCRVF